MSEIKSQINYQEFSKIDIRVGTIIEVEEITNSEKLFKLLVDFGDLGQRQILSGIKKWYSSDELKGSQVCFVINLEPRQMMGLTSGGMILAADSGEDEKPVIIVPKEFIQNGSGIH